MLWLLLNVRRYDAVTTTPISTSAPGLLASLLGKPWLVDVSDLWIDTSISLGYIEFRSTIPALALQIADRIAVMTETLGDSRRDLRRLAGGEDGDRSQRRRHRPIPSGSAAVETAGAMPSSAAVDETEISLSGLRFSPQ
ncbi:hypothetical protein [Haloarcula sebkhae]|uniref:Uncharacterized protein n=2 Tax=Haloarcula sebkhae TaxID=932660 RepID=A0ACC6VN39_9EURY|nr:hypothetical protein [Haloarcula sebkhae]GGK72734.1 hypothetical protein GCM10009067_26270 [Haloarcula sebkhae]